jgi:hypothetical protein
MGKGLSALLLFLLFFFSCYYGHYGTTGEHNMFSLFQDNPKSFRVLVDRQCVGTIRQRDDGLWKVENISPSYVSQSFKNFVQAVSVFGDYNWKSYLSRNSTYRRSTYEKHRESVTRKRFSLS